MKKRLNEKENVRSNHEVKRGRKCHESPVFLLVCMAMVHETEIKPTGTFIKHKASNDKKTQAALISFIFTYFEWYIR